jgi:hypothetical protein
LIALIAEHAVNSSMGITPRVGDGSTWSTLGLPGRLSTMFARFLILLKDLQELFDYVEPADKNLSCYSYRIHALSRRACVEVEANCKAILKENGYTKSGDWNMGDYKKIEKTHLLSG